jgi:hypothetical protein
MQKKPNYVPRLRTKKELEREVKYHKSWKGGDNSNELFSEVSIMKPKILDPWAMGRVQMPERGYNKFFFSKLTLLSYSQSL